MAIGTYNGLIKIFGQPGVECYGRIESQTDCAASDIQMLEFVYGNGQLVSLSSVNHLTLWEPKNGLIIAKTSKVFEEKSAKISALCCSLTPTSLWVGTENGEVFELEINTFELKSHSITNNAVHEQ